VFGTELSHWIARGDRGVLTRLDGDVFVWTVPDDIRPKIRHHLWNAGLLIEDYR
jgi:hypothetical protein